MKKNYVTQAINLKNYPLNDNDSIVVMFSKTKGLLHAIAKGAKRPKSKLGARIQMFVANDIMLNEGKNLDTIAQAQSLNTFSKIRSDLDKMSYSMYIGELVNSFCSNADSQSENFEEIYNLIFNTYEKIASSKDKKEIILNTLKFQINIINILGWGLDFEYCSMCQKKIEQDAIYTTSHGMLCENCAKEKYDYTNIKLNTKIKMFLSELTKFENTKYDELVNEVVVQKCFLFMKKYIDTLTNKKTKIFEVLKKVTVSA